MAGGARYYVDGYNLLLRQRLGEGASLAERRAELLARLAATGLSACVVFDSRESIHGVAPSTPRRIELLFAPPGKSGDELLLQQLRRAADLGAAVVVSDDRAVVERAAFLGARTLSTKEFARRLQPAPPAASRGDRKLTREEVSDWMKWFGYEKDSPAGARGDSKPAIPEKPGGRGDARSDAPPEKPGGRGRRRRKER